MSVWLSIWLLLHGLFAQGIPFPGFIIATGGGGGPSFVNSVANFCTYGIGVCPGPNISVTAGNSLYASISFYGNAFVTCGTGGTLTAKLSDGTTSLTQIGTNLVSVSTNICSAQFRVNSLPSTTATEHVDFTYSGTGFASVVEIQTTAFTTEDASCTGLATSSPTTCGTGMTVANAILLASYGNFNAGGTLTWGGGFTAGAAYAGAGGFTPAIAAGYQVVTSSSTYNPSIADTTTIDSSVMAVTVH